jgi:hypothetical protein
MVRGKLAIRRRKIGVLDIISLISIILLSLTGEKKEAGSDT